MIPLFHLYWTNSSFKMANSDLYRSPHLSVSTMFKSQHSSAGVSVTKIPRHHQSLKNQVKYCFSRNHLYFNNCFIYQKSTKCRRHKGIIRITIQTPNSMISTDKNSMKFNDGLQSVGNLSFSRFMIIQFLFSNRSHRI